jgi:hypothetical protein
VKEDSTCTDTAANCSPSSGRTSISRLGRLV